jgi:hypothetical protein
LAGWDEVIVRITGNRDLRNSTPQNNEGGATAKPATVEADPRLTERS